MSPALFAPGHYQTAQIHLLETIPPHLHSLLLHLYNGQYSRHISLDSICQTCLKRELRSDKVSGNLLSEHESLRVQGLVLREHVQGTLVFSHSSHAETHLRALHRARQSDYLRFFQSAFHDCSPTGEAAARSKIPLFTNFVHGIGQDEHGSVPGSGCHAIVLDSDPSARVGFDERYSRIVRDWGVTALARMGRIIVSLINDCLFEQN